MLYTHAEELNFAIHDCFDECLKSEHPLACLALYCRQLRELRQWPACDIHEFDTIIRHMLRSVFDSWVDDGDVLLQPNVRPAD